MSVALEFEELTQQTRIFTATENDRIKVIKLADKFRANYSQALLDVLIILSNTIEYYQNNSDNINDDMMLIYVFKIKKSFIHVKKTYQDCFRQDKNNSKKALQYYQIEKSIDNLIEGIDVVIDSIEHFIAELPVPESSSVSVEDFFKVLNAK